MSEHKYMKLAQTLRQNIISGVYPNESRLPGENELVQNTGYSRQTVRQAIGVLEKEGMARRIQGSGTFVNLKAEPRETTHNIAVVTTYISEYIFPAVLSGIAEVLSEGGYTSMVAATLNRVGNERKVLAEFMNKPIDGLIVEGTKTALPNPNVDLYEHFARQGVAVVFINGCYAELGSPVCVSTDDEGGGETACNILLKKGHKKIAGIFKFDDVQGLNRYAGYTKALREAGLTVEDENILWYGTGSAEVILNGRLEKVIEGCTAAVCYNDEITVQVISALQRMGKELPEFVSFDRSAVSQFSPTPFYSLGYPNEELGRAAARKLLGILQGKTEKSAVFQWKVEYEEESYGIRNRD